MHTLGAPTVTTGIAATLTVPDALLVAGANGSSTYAYRLFARDVLGSETTAGPITTIDSATALGASRIQIATWGLIAESNSTYGCSTYFIIPFVLTQFVHRRRMTGPS